MLYWNRRIIKAVQEYKCSIFSCKKRGWVRTYIRILRLNNKHYCPFYNVDKFRENWDPHRTLTHTTNLLLYIACFKELLHLLFQKTTLYNRTNREREVGSEVNVFKKDKD